MSRGDEQGEPEGEGSMMKISWEPHNVQKDE